MPSACPDDFVAPEDMKVLGTHHDQELFILRMRTVDYPVKDVVAMFRASMENEGWELRVDSATDENGGELIFAKGDNRRCTIFISHAAGAEKGLKPVNIDVKCDRKIKTT